MVFEAYTSCSRFILNEVEWSGLKKPNGPVQNAPKWVFGFVFRCWLTVILFKD